MRFAIRISSFLVVGFLLHLFLSFGVDDEVTSEEETVYRDWAVSMATKQQVGWDEYYGIEDLSQPGNYDQKPYADPDLYAADRTVLRAGQTWRGAIALVLSGGYEDSRIALGERYPHPLDINVLRNELSQWDVDVQIENVRTEPYVYPTWQVRRDRGTRTLKNNHAHKEAWYTGAMSREQISAAMAEGHRFNVGGFDPERDLIRGEGSGWRALVDLRITVPPGAPVRPDDPSIWGQFTIAGNDRNRPYRAHLIHLESYEGIALRPVQR